MIEIPNQRRAWNKAVRRQLDSQQRYDDKVNPIESEIAGFANVLARAESIREARVADAQRVLDDAKNSTLNTANELGALEELLEEQLKELEEITAQLNDNIAFSRRRIDDHRKLLEAKEQAEQLARQARDYQTTAPVLDDKEMAKHEELKRRLAEAKRQAMPPLQARTKAVDKLRRRFNLPDGFLETIPEPPMDPHSEVAEAVYGSSVPEYQPSS